MTLREKIATSRQFLGLGPKELAYRLGIAPSTLSRWALLKLVDAVGKTKSL